MKVFVDYQLLEYLELLKEVVPIVVFQNKTGDWPKEKPKCGFGTRILINVAGPLSFIYKKWQVGVCSFSLTENSIVRDSKSGSHEFDCSELDCILGLSNAYLIIVEKGFMPLPYRCFEKNQKVAFEEIYKDRLRWYTR